MLPAKVGIMGQPPTLGIEAVENETLALAEWCGKMAGKYENQSRKFLKIAEKLRELDRAQPFIRHHAACPISRWGEKDADLMGKSCNCGLHETG